MLPGNRDLPRPAQFRRLPSLRQQNRDNRVKTCQRVYDGAFFEQHRRNFLSPRDGVRMKQKLLWIVLVFVAAAQAAILHAETQYPPDLQPIQQEARAAHLSAELLTRYHYKRVPLDSGMSEKIFDRYLNSLDPEKLFFLQTDIDRFADDRDRLGQAMLEEDLSAPFAIYNLYRRRAVERFEDARAMLVKGFDFQKDESYEYAREDSAWPQTESDMREQWRKRVKNDWLRLKLAGKDDQSIVEILDKRYDNFLKHVRQITRADVFQTYMNAYAMSIEPHTGYMGVRAAEEFDISMKLSLVGIGAVLTNVNDYVTIREMVPGGPASMSGVLKVGDRIVGVGQGEGGAITDIQGWRLDDTVRLIRGEPDTVVVLDILPADVGLDADHAQVMLVRKKINLEKQSASASVHSTVKGKLTLRVGVIKLPSFYEDFAAKQSGVQEYKSASRDVARLLGDLKKEKVDAILIDLRDNGGGSLTEAVDLTGLFIDTGPVVQRRDATGEIIVETDSQPGVAWDGPLGVLINRGSASASEIFAAAIQDYGRGVIVGDQSFGKGTVQRMIDLDEIANNSKPQFGELRMTIAQFFRINGGTTQLRGVIPDIAFPAVYDVEDFGESSFDNALPWTQIKDLDYHPVGNMKDLLPVLVSLHETRVSSDKEFQYLQEDIAESNRQRNSKVVSLNQDERRKERDARENRLKARKAQRDSEKGGSGVVVREANAPAKDGAIRDDGLRPDERDLADQLAAEKARQNARDVLLDEAVNIVGDAAMALKTDDAFAARVKPGSPMMAE
jgi:carboxyl-terminal processing protease